MFLVLRLVIQQQSDFKEYYFFRSFFLSACGGSFDFTCCLLVKVGADFKDILKNSIK